MEEKPSNQYYNMYCNHRSNNLFNHIVMLRIILEIYFGINLLILGMSIDPEDKRSNLAWFNVILFFLFGIVIIVAVFIYDYYLKPLFGALRLKFLWQFYFTNRWSNMKISALFVLNKWLYTVQSRKNTPKNWIYKRSLRMIFKRNNYIEQEYKTGLEWLGTIPKSAKVTILSPDGWFNQKDFVSTLITKKQFIENMKDSAIKHNITFDINRF